MGRVKEGQVRQRSDVAEEWVAAKWVTNKRFSIS